METIELTQTEVLDRLYGFLTHAKKVQDLKDTLLYCQTFGDCEETVENSLIEAQIYTEQIDEIYQGSMIPLLEGIVEFLSAHPEQVEDILIEEAEMDDG